METRDTGVPPGGSIGLPFTVTRSSEGTGLDVAVRFLVTYSLGIPGTAEAIPEEAVADLNVKAAASPSLVEAKIESNVTSINENRPGEAALVITNPRDATIHILAIHVRAPDAVDVTLDCPSGHGVTTRGGHSEAYSKECNFPINARSQEVLHVSLNTNDSVAPGPRTVVVKVAAEDPDVGTSASAVATLPFTLEVFAETDILKSIGVPIFLLLPGAVFVVVFWGLFSKLSPWRSMAANLTKGSTGSGGISVGNTALAVVLALGVSLVMAWAYPHLTASVWPKPGERDYLKAYGFRDFYYVLGYSFAVAIALWVLAWLAYLLVLLQRLLLVPASDDEPRALLRKLALRGLLRRDSRLRRVMVKDGKGLEVYRSLSRGRMVVPTIQVSISAGAANGADGLAAKVESAAGKGRSVELWRTVDRAVRDKQATLAYPPGDVVEPTLVSDESTITDTGQYGAIVEVATT